MDTSCGALSGIFFTSTPSTRMSQEVSKWLVSIYKVHLLTKHRVSVFPNAGRGSKKLQRLGEAFRGERSNLAGCEEQCQAPQRVWPTATAVAVGWDGMIDAESLWKAHVCYTCVCVCVYLFFK